jgi:hypothetical protein
MEHEEEGVMEATLGPGVRLLVGDEHHHELPPVAPVLADGGLPAPAVAALPDGKGLLALAELFPKFAAPAGTIGLAVSLAYPLELLRGDGELLPRLPPPAGPRTAGSGDAVLVGGEGEDVVIGDRGRDRLVGGIGGSRGVSPPEDAVVAGPGRHQVREGALHTLLQEWTEAEAYLNLLDS